MRVRKANSRVDDARASKENPKANLAVAVRGPPRLRAVPAGSSGSAALGDPCRHLLQGVSSEAPISGRQNTAAPAGLNGTPGPSESGCWVLQKKAS